MSSTTSKVTSHEDRRKLGAFYTPPELAQIMACWAIRSARDTILEPSFGGCCFVNASWDRLRELGNKQPFKKLHGADIDKKAFAHLRKRFPSQIFTRQFVLGDYLYLPEDAFKKAKFDVIIGNPPYIGYASQTPSQRTYYKKNLLRQGIVLKGRPSLWAYFVLTSLSRLNQKGRIAWVLPWSYMSTDYGAQLRDVLRQHFQKMLVFAIEENLFLSEGTKERSVVLLAEGYSADPITTNETVEFCPNMQDFNKRLIAKVNDTKNTNSEAVFCARRQAEKKIRQSSLTPYLRPLGDLGTIDIGVVTGDIRTFLLTKSIASDLGLHNKALQICLIRSQHIPGLTLNESDLDALDNQGIPTQLLTLPPDEPVKQEVKRYLQSRWPTKEVIENATFQKREIWYSIPKQQPPDGLISYFSARGPRFIINKCHSAATNSMFCFWLDRSIVDNKKYNVLASISLSMLSGLGRSYAELYASRFGNGAIKLGVGTLKKMPIFIAPVEHVAETQAALVEADQELRNGEQDAAAKIANRWLRAVSKAPRIVQEIETAASRMLNDRLSRTKE